MTAGASDPPVAIRGLQTADIPAVVALICAADAVDGADEGTSETEFRAWLGAAGGAGNSFVAVDAGGAVVGYSDVHYRSGDEGVWGWVVVHPDRRRAGIGSSLAARVLARARALGVRWIDYAVDTRLVEANRWLAHLGYEPVRTYTRRRLDPGVPVPPPAYPSGFAVRTFRSGTDEAIVRRLLSAAFGDHHNLNEADTAGLAENLGAPGFDPRGLFLAQPLDGPVAGLCWCAIHPEENARRGEAAGWISDLAVAPAYRRQGLGRALLLEGIAWLRGAGMAYVDLWMDSGNRPAAALYTVLGFRVDKTITTYRHFLLPAPAAGPGI